VQSQSGTGKTCVFCLGALQSVDTSSREPQALFLSPTRELAEQSQKVCLALGDYLNVQVHVCIGGKRVSDDIHTFEAGVQIVSGTPGRVFHMIQQRHFSTRHARETHTMAPAAMSFVRLHALRRPLGFALLGLCGLGQKPFLSAAGGALPLDELSALHQKFGGDASVWANQPMPQRARSGGTISALSVQIPALERLAPYLRPGASVFDLGFGSGVMTAMLLAAAPSSGVRVIGVDLEDKVKVATENMLKTSGPFRFQREQFEFLGGDAFHCLQRWKDEGKTFDVVYSGCSFDPDTQQLALFLGRLKPTGAAVFNLGNPGKQGMYFVADGGKKCELLMRVNFMMAESPLTPPASDSVPLDPSRLGQWIQQNIFTDKEL
ncbi:unnamed protein product, partial [Cladocopium goreaui]